MNIIFWNIRGIDNNDSRLDNKWFTMLPTSLLADFVRDMNGMPNYRFPQLFRSVVFLVYIYFSFEGFGLVPPYCKYFPIFLMILRIGKAVEDGGFYWVPTQLGCFRFSRMPNISLGLIEKKSWCVVGFVNSFSLSH